METRNFYVKENNFLPCIINKIRHSDKLKKINDTQTKIYFYNTWFFSTTNRTNTATHRSS
jgi:hypothetical protein